MAIHAEIAKEFRFEAAHFLPAVPESHQCHKIHGHSYRLVIRVKGPIDEKMGWVMDLAELVALWIFRKLEPGLPLITSVTLEANNRIAVTISKDKLH